jgi:hypothetical protein
VTDREVPAEVPELFEVVMRAAFRGLDAERGVPARSAQAGEVVPHLFLRRQREEALAALERPGDELVGDAVVLEDDEAVLLVRRAEGLRRANEDEGTGVSERDLGTSESGTRREETRCDDGTRAGRETRALRALTNASKSAS